MTFILGFQNSIHPTENSRFILEVEKIGHSDRPLDKKINYIKSLIQNQIKRHEEVQQNLSFLRRQLQSEPALLTLFDEAVLGIQNKNYLPHVESLQREILKENPDRVFEKFNQLFAEFSHANAEHRNHRMARLKNEIEQVGQQYQYTVGKFSLKQRVSLTEKLARVRAVCEQEQI